MKPDFHTDRKSDLQITAKSIRSESVEKAEMEKQNMDGDFATTNIFYTCGYESGYEIGYEAGLKEWRDTLLEDAKKLGPEIYLAVIRSI